MTDKPVPKIGVGVFVRRDGKILCQLRKGAHEGGTWGLPGGHLEMGETWEDCARRETLEETGVEVSPPRFLAATNDLYPNQKHYVTLFMVCDWVSGEATVQEPEKCFKWEWVNPHAFPSPMFLPMENFFALGIDPMKG